MNKNRRLTAAAAFVGYAATIPLANWLISNVGTQPAPNGPHVIPVGFGLSAPSGVLAIGLALVLRDAVQQLAGKTVVLAAIAVGTVLSVAISPALAVASGAAFAFGELADFGVYTPLRQQHLIAAVIASGVVGAIIDSAIFLWLAFSSLDFVAGNVVGKVWMSLLGGLFIVAGRRLPASVQAWVEP